MSKQPAEVALIKSRLIRERPREQGVLQPNNNSQKHFFYLSNKLTIWPKALTQSKHKHSPGEGNLKWRREGDSASGHRFGQIKLTLKTIQCKTQQKLMSTCQWDGANEGRGVNVPSWMFVHVHGGSLHWASRSVCVNHKYPLGQHRLRPLWSNFTDFIKQQQFIHFSESGYMTRRCGMGPIIRDRIRWWMWHC